MKNSITIIAVSLLCALAACLSGCTAADYTATWGSEGPAVIYPDYKGVTVPANIAPLNFRYAVRGATSAKTTFTCGDASATIGGLDVEWSLNRWKKFLSRCTGCRVEVLSVVKVEGKKVEERWWFDVSEDPVDAYLTYRLIEPGYEVWHEVQIRERCVENFGETVISDYRHTDNACMNCHIHGSQRGDLSLFYIRGPKGGAILNRDGMLRKLNLKADGMLSATVYGDLHPSGRYGVFSTNIIIPGFHTGATGRLEVYDTASDLTVADFDSNRMINVPQTARADVFETFPCFTADGEKVIYCAADTVSLPQDVDKLRYSLVSVPFDPSTGEIGSPADTLWSAAERGGSVCHPRCSPDGRWVMFTVADYGTFPVWHRECELQMIDLQSGEVNNLDAIKAEMSDTYHSWSSNGRWIVFASKRGDGQYGKPYFSHIDEDGNATKPFVLPQRSARFYDNNLKSFNIPDLGRESVGMNARQTGALLDVAAEAFE